MITHSRRKAIFSSALLAAVVAGVVAMAATPTPSAPASAPAVDQNGPTIKDTYKGLFLIGTAADVPSGFSELDLKILKENYNVITAENCMKPGPTHPSEDRYDWSRSDAFVDWAVKNNIKIHGHCLAWHSQTTSWMFQGGADKATVVKRLQDHIKTVVGRYKGKIMSWDVVNEAINDGGNAQTTVTENLRSSPYLSSMGPEFLEIAFKAAHEADPDARLYYNDYNIENGFKHGSSMALLKRLIKNGAPIHGVGIQGHWSTRGAPLAECDKSISDYASLGLKVSVSELDITTTGVQGGQLNPAGGAAPAGGGRGGATGALLMDNEGFYFTAAPAAGGAGGRGAGRGAPGGGGSPNLAATIQTAVTDLSADQQSKLTAASEALTAKLTEWQTSSQAALQPLQPTFTPGQPTDQSAQDKYNAELYKQNLLREDLLNDAEVAMIAILKPAQAEKWESSRLNAQLTAELGSLGWSVAQKSKIDPTVAETATKLAGAKDRATLVNARANFWNKVAAQLNDVQITQVFAPTFATGRGGFGGGGGALAGAGGPGGAGAAGGGMGGRGGGGGAAPSAEVLKAQADTYAKAFAIFVKHKDVMERVTFWGLNDRRSWRQGSNPLILDGNNLRKPCYISIVDVILKPNPSLWPN